MNIDLVTFNNGIMTPKTDARSDVEKYRSSCRDLDNMIPLIYGCVEKRPGTYFVYKSEEP